MIYGSRHNLIMVRAQSRVGNEPSQARLGLLADRARLDSTRPLNELKEEARLEVGSTRKLKEEARLDSKLAHYTKLLTSLKTWSISARSRFASRFEPSRLLCLKLFFLALHQSEHDLG